eukprot:511656-Hanusia_phi.AAC.1
MSLGKVPGSQERGPGQEGGKARERSREQGQRDLYGEGGKVRARDRARKAKNRAAETSADRESRLARDRARKAKNK